MRSITIVRRGARAVGLGVMVLLAGCAGSGAGVPGASTFQWSSSAPLIAPPADKAPKTYGLKDASIVQSGGKYHVFMTTASENGWGLAYTSFTDWSQASTAAIVPLDKSPMGPGYRAAPQVFYFAPQHLWYLVYQGGDPMYSTSKDVGDPLSWNAPKPFFGTPPEIVRQPSGEAAWLDFWTICDTSNCYLFSSDDNGHIYRSQTTLANFPNGFGNTVIALQDSRFALFEGSAVYKVTGSNQYLLLQEAIGSDGRRWYRSFTSSSLAGSWSPHLATESNPFARSNNVTFSGSAWTRDFSHGELIRSGNDQTMPLSPCRLQFLYQGQDPNASGDYIRLPWRMGLLTQTNSSC